MNKKIFFLMGPTATGKTDLAVELVKHFPLEIISVDSAMIYRGMNIGSAKPDKKILKIAPHHLIDICDPSERYSAAQFREDALKKIKEIFSRNKMPLLVGGTMLYFKTLQFGMADLPRVDETIRQKIFMLLQEKGVQYLHQQLMKVDPITAQRLHQNDKQRISRALEIYEVSKKPMSKWIEEAQHQALDEEVITIALIPKERSILHEKIELRLKIMLQQGFVDEVKALMKRGDLSKDLPSMRAVGYRQIWEGLEQNWDEEQLFNQILFATRQFAKRQITWLKHWPSELHCFEPYDHKLKDKIFKLIELSCRVRRN